MRVAELWRYPVKSMRGERLDAAEVLEDGVVGDRLVHVVDAGGQLVTGRTRPGLLGLTATLGPDGALVDGAPWRSDAAGRAVARAAGDGARLVDAAADGLRFDESALLVASDGMAGSFGIDRRRLRPNVVLGGVEGMAERGWEGRRLRIGEVVIRLDHLCLRCVMTTFDPDTLEQDPDVLRRINAELGGLAALNSLVERPGRIAVGDEAELV
ncbi:MAG TPA: MOSC N-terminal beta barrel domain-containing protein [Thermoleophilaceae bacterium]|jgi:hypothetical protein